MELLRAGKDEAERQRIKAQLYQPPQSDRGGGGRARKGRKRGKGSRSAAEVEPAGREARGMTRAEAEQLADQIAEEDAKLTGRRPQSHRP